MVVQADSPNGKPGAEAVRYRKTEHQSEVEVKAWFYPDGTTAFSQWDMWDVRGYDFTPCAIEIAFAQSLRGQLQCSGLPLLDLDAHVADGAAVNWVTEPARIATGIAMLDGVLRQFSLKHMNGEHLLSQIADAVQQGRRLAEEKRAAKAEAARLSDLVAHVETRIDHWMRVVDRIVTAGRSKGHPPHDEPGKAA